MIIRDPGSDEDRTNDGELPKDVRTEEKLVPHSDVEVSDRQPKGDHNRRLALGVDVDDFALEAGVPVEALRDYERTGPDHDFDLEVAARVGSALERLEANPPSTQKVLNGPNS